MNLRTQQQVWAYLKPRLRGTWYRLEARLPSGLPDAVGFLGGLTLWVEIKTPDDKLRASQKLFAAAAAARGVTIWIARARGDHVDWHQGPKAVPCSPPMFFDPVPRPLPVRRPRANPSAGATVSDR